MGEVKILQPELVLPTGWLEPVAYGFPATGEGRPDYPEELLRIARLYLSILNIDDIPDKEQFYPQIVAHDGEFYLLGQHSRVFAHRVLDRRCKFVLRDESDYQKPEEYYDVMCQALGSRLTLLKVGASTLDDLLDRDLFKRVARRALTSDPCLYRFLGDQTTGRLDAATDAICAYLERTKK
ncbi:hypothetical protein HY493_04225 [Candidatus Woesearchaeota archaeon]|nr:hypothetical protein [Candidatus Woesearchaeota archaeon]